jgi:hypothetical protein
MNPKIERQTDMGDLIYTASYVSEGYTDSNLSLERETQQLFSQGYSSYSISAPDYKSAEPKAERIDPGFGRHIREAVALVRDWTKD